MLNDGDVVRFKDKNDWPEIDLGIVEEPMPSMYQLRSGGGIVYRVRFEYGQGRLHHFTVPVDEKWLEKI